MREVAGGARLRWTVALAGWICAAGIGSGAQERGPEKITPQALHAAIEQLGQLDYEVRTGASRTVRRAPAAEAVPALVKAVSGHADGFVRYRALVLLTGFGGPPALEAARRVISDPNDRLRQVAYGYFEHHPDPSIVPALLQALEREESEFVRPALIRALAAHQDQPRVQQALLVEVRRGQDFFRSAVIEALGDYRAVYAVPALMEIAGQDGPLQNDAALALGKIGDKRALPVLASLQQSAPRGTQPYLAAGICLLGVNCASHRTYLIETLTFSIREIGFQDLIRAAASGLAALAVAGDRDALVALIDQGIPTRDPARAPIALAIGTVALRNTPLTLAILEIHPERARAIELVGEAFDMLEEDFEEERFFVAVRREYWQAPENAPVRAVAEALIRHLEF
jgi:HEAT repeat protein